MASNVLTDVQTYLAGAGLGLTAGTNLFRSLMPPTPDVAVALHLYDGFPPEPGLGSDGGVLRAEYPMIQVEVRGVEDDFDGPYAMAQQIMEKLLLVGSRPSIATLSGTIYQAIVPKQQPFLRNRDENFRCYVVFKCQVYKDY